MRTHYDEALEVYQKLIEEHPDYLALYIYIGMCQFKLDQFQEANQSADVYLAKISDSAVGLNLKACAYFHIFDTEIESLSEAQILQIHKFGSASYRFADDLIAHNLCVFRGGVDGFNLFPKLLSSIPEARFNLAVLYMRDNLPLEAHLLMNDFKPLDVNQIFLKAAISLAVGEMTSDANLIEEANRTFGEIGNMEDVKDTILGRQALSTSHFIQSRFGRALEVLVTIEQFMKKCDEFFYTKGVAYASSSEWVEGEKALLKVESAAYKKEVFYKEWLCRCYMRNKRFEKGWQMYMDELEVEHARALLNVIAFDGYEMGGYLWCMRAYDILARQSEEPTLKMGCIVSGIAVFRDYLGGKGTMENVEEVFGVLREYEEALDYLEVMTGHLADASF
jgi:intraflagellar transport protein 56